MTGKRLRDPRSRVFEERQRLSRGGVVVVVAAIDSQGRVLSRKPEIVSSGVIEGKQRAQVLAQAMETVVAALRTEEAATEGWDTVSARVKERLGSFLYNETGQRPTIHAVAVEV